MQNSKTMQAPSHKRGNSGTSGARRLGDRIFFNATLIFALLIVAILIGLLIVLNMDAMPAINKFGLAFLTDSSWDPVKEVFGALPAIYGTLLSSIIGLVIAVPVSLGAAIFLAELAPRWLSRPGSFLIEMLAAIPSVIIGLWGLFVMVPVIRNPVESWLGSTLGFLPLFQGPPFGVGFLAAGVILAIMIIPIITAVSREVMEAVPDTQREAMLALGATRWEMIQKAVLPYCRSGLTGAIILGLGRALGETMAVTMVIGNSYAITESLFSPGVTIASKIASEFSEASGDVYIGSLVELALVLFVITLLVNIIARLLVWRMTTVKAVIG
ncbi:MAG: phosphate ABC transporter permease subunit PstC [Dehalococcoidia bacterium]|nr:phosphate ABC transporter permease subunit PstC [Dehalococcoidia bacterium]MDD5493352.1 phosphate ABC transporter permease subunit PstC [Dehalococcoidia bacterium]